MNSANAIVTLNARATSLFQNLRPDTLTREIPNFAAEFGTVEAICKRDSWVFVGRLVPEKGVSWLLQNWPHSQKLTFVGSGPLSREVIRAEKEFPNVFRYKGQMKSSEVRDLIAGSVGLVIPSLWSEGVPTVALEALQSGTPIVISENCASASSLTADGAGEMFPHSIEPDAFSVCLDRIKALDSYRHNARKLYEKRYAPGVWLAQIQDLYSRLTSL
ncbi:glycosyltransferase family 4 protein [Rhodococcus sp. B7740]|uniref:glycosyltransferase family 4 protein n=1 Tax=Rhodococcus sp. B7740 TaxID=1564114 RepID=UPI001F2B0AB1|nr:glycosyltransferase [Rhodococcus sp. B7740]